MWVADEWSFETQPDPGASGRRRPAPVVSGEEIRGALARQELVLHYQPVVDLRTGRTHGVEALLRWQHPNGGLLPPGGFLPAVAQAPVMDDVTRWVLATACDAAGQWAQCHMAVNIAARNLTRPQFVEDVQDALESSALEPSRLLLELTEDALVRDLPSAVNMLSRLRNLGVRLALDDFGTGYSSMIYLRELPVTELKIDQSFVRGLGDNAEDTAIVASVVNLALAVDLNVVAEGVETEGQRQQLHELGCTFGQGYFFSRPRPASRVDPSARYRTERRPERRRRDQGPIPAETLRRMRDLVQEGASRHTIAAALNREGLRTPVGTRWHASSVAKALAGQPAT